MMKKSLLAVFILVATPALAFAGGPVSHLPVKAQLHQEALTAHGLRHALAHGAPVSKITPRVQGLNFALQNTAAQMHTKASFAQAANRLIGIRITRADLSRNLKADAQWVQARLSN